MPLFCPYNDASSGSSFRSLKKGLTKQSARKYARGADGRAASQLKYNIRSRMNQLQKNGVSSFLLYIYRCIKYINQTSAIG